MLIYLLKVSFIWLVLLLIFESGFKKSRNFRLNRIYIFISILAGLLIPIVNISMLPSDVAIPEQRIAQAYTKTIETITPGNTAAFNASWDWGKILLGLYIAGACIAFLFTIREIILILKKAIYGNYEITLEHKIFSSKKQHAPFSFMGWIFISDLQYYSENELQYILQHEDAHNRYYHWIDMIGIQVIFILFWFHPFVWWFRHILKMNHEFEADSVAASDNPYEYGHFLIQQTLLKGTPVIAHSFHFSPIKNRITMLTQKRKSSTWKYALVLPVLCCFTVLFAKSTPGNQRIKEGDVSTFKGHKFYWKTTKPDSVVQKAIEMGFAQFNPQTYIYRMDNDSVYQHYQLSINPQFRSGNKGFSEYITEQLKEKYKGIIDTVTIARIHVSNVVINEKGKIVYYELTYMSQSDHSKAITSNTVLDPIVDQIIEESPAWLPGVYNGKEVMSYMDDGGEFVLGSIRFKVVAFPVKKN
ncbi:M56 family metallopeptidase [Taibaiella lutea]|uniref:M56 family metallopeptidase n=1 Tax=Taibaiella lutea TaxID=2608001 RepID=A0A5M6CU31_9BACT|nr:M56 family metallopeptidase [Taibaiella lutea]KAA5537482.1 M56 family metallopeptidase [Taibaiella lutea]